MIRCAGTIALLLVALPAIADERVSYNWQIRPILSENCFACHGNDANARKADLRLDQPSAAVVAGQPHNSELMRRITSDDPDVRMPPPESGPALPDEAITTIQHWIQEGAKYERHWSFEPPARVTPPPLADTAGATNAVDQFIGARLAAEGLAFSPEAPRRTLLRRAYLDLIGLPPSPSEMDAFLSDDEPGAYERVVDALLDSPHFGERWGRHWLDAARYADSTGYSEDSPRSIWPYRDWVIRALNANKPFDEFVVEQLAGDMLPNAAKDQKIATGFHRNTMMNEEGGIDEEEFRLYAVIDRVNTTGSVFLGLTVGCAQCHDHKYDPVSQTEFYGLLAFYNNDNERAFTVSPPSDIAEREAQEAELGQLRSEYVAYVEKNLPAWEASLTEADLAEFDPDVRASFRVEPDARDKRERILVASSFLAADEFARKQNEKLIALEESLTPIYETQVLEARRGLRTTRLLTQGDYTRPADPVEPHVPSVLHELPGDLRGTRLELANWIVDPDNPLTARVTVNRMWQRLFGRGIVETENDFGTRGAQPSHPALLDWLAVRFVDSGWDMKAMIRLLVTSATNRQASDVAEELQRIDPDNRLLARQSRLRLDAEIIRDSGLAVSGLLDTHIGGPSVFPPQPEGVMTLGRLSREWETDTDWRRYRRGMYTYFWRATPHPALMVFDAPSATTSCTRRMRSNTPLQALTLLNDTAFVEMAAALATRLSDHGSSDAQRIDHAFDLCLGRAPTATERSVVRKLLDSSAQPGANRWQPAARVMLNLDEFITRE